MNSNKNEWSRLRKFAALLLVAGLLAAAAAGCGSGAGTTGGDSPDSPVPDFQQPIQKAKDTANQAQQQQKQAEDSAKQLLQSP
ncbi:MAG: hypothetical protein ACYC6B_00910 [Thermoleophilia bacterium]